jgi:hypothetical protein
MREGLTRGLAALALVVAGCGGETSEPTEPWPPTSELIFRLDTTTTTTRPPSQLDPVPIDTIGATVSIPRDWGWETESLQHGAGAAVFVAANRAGGLIIVGDLRGLGAEAGTAPTTAGEAATVLAELLDLPPGEPQLTLVNERETAAGTRTTYSTVQEDGTGAVVEIVLSGEVFVAFLYEDLFPENRVAQGEAALLSLVVE